MRNSLRMIQYTLYALLIFALSGCGANGLNSAGNNQPGTVTAKLIMPKSSAKTTAAVAPASITKIRLKVTGPTIPTASEDFATPNGAQVNVYPGSQLIVAAQAFDATGKVIFEGFAVDQIVTSGADTPVTIAMVSPKSNADETSCFNCHDNTRDATGQNIVANFKQTGHYSNNSQEGVTVVFNGRTYATSPGCAGCHGPSHNDVSPSINGRCYDCHASLLTNVDTNHVTVPFLNAGNNNCTDCHNPHNTKKVAGGSGSCIACHSVGQNAGDLPFAEIDPVTGALLPNKYVNDNTGVRAILPEFAKRSHHITGAAPTDAQCVVCHLEGRVVSGAIAIDATKHMADNKIHLRNADTNADFVWGGTEHTNMDNFCFSCHDNNGATGLAAAGLNAVTGGTASNPFGDTLTNSYDQVARAGVVDVKTAFTTTNASHHAVSGQRYTYRFSTLANATAWAARTGNPVPAASEIAEGHVVNGVTSPFGTGLTYDPLGPEEGGEATLYEGGKFVSTYIPLGASLNVADNSTLHCGDCHTVGQWKVGSSTNADGSATSVAIGAHGSANEYLLRNSEGTDVIHNGRTYVCFNCHVASSPTTQDVSNLTLWNELIAEGHILPSTATVGTYVNNNGLNPVTVPVNKSFTLVPSWKAGWNALHPTVIPGAIHGYATAHAVSAMHIQCEADSADNISSSPARGFNNFSSDRLQKSWAPQTVKIYDYLPAAGATATAPAGGSNAASGNITGIACTNCHNSGLRSGFGGIHGGDNTYTDGLGRVQKSYRFMPGMGNYRYAPPGGWDGKDVSDPTLLTATNPLQENGPANGSGSLGFPGTSGKPIGGCYTNGGTGAAGSDLNNSGGVTYGVCNHHGTSTSAPVGATSVGVPKTTVTGNTANFRATYGGGTTGSPTTYEPTVREATAGGTLVTRPLQY